MTAFTAGGMRAADALFIGASASLFIAGAMDLRAMAAATLVIAGERLAPNDIRIAYGSRVCAIAAGIHLLVRAITM